MVAAGKSLLRCPRSLVIVKASLANESHEEQEIEGQWSPVGEQVSLQDFGRNQQEDTNLINAFGNVVVVNGKMVAALPPECVPYFIVKNDLLYRVTFLQGKKVKQLLVPRKQLVLKAAHTFVGWPFGGGENLSVHTVEVLMAWHPCSSKERDAQFVKRQHLGQSLERPWFPSL